MAVLVVLSVVAAAAETRPVVAVWDLEGRHVKLSKEELSRLTDRLANLVVESGRYQITPRAEVQRLLAEQKRASYRVCYDEACQIELGKELAAQKSLSGSVERWGTECVVSLRLYDLARATGEAAGSARGGCRAEQVLGLLETAFRQLSGTGTVEPRSARASRTDSLAAEPGAMIVVAGGDFFRGCDDETDARCFIDEKPGRIVFLPEFRIDRTEVTVRAYERCVEAGGCSAAGIEMPFVQGEKQSWSGGLCNWRQAGRAEHPINCVNWTHAERYCRWAGKRLPTESEWEKAARGSDRRRFPWGFDLVHPEPRTNLADQTARRTFRTLVAMEAYDDGFAGTAPVGSFPAGASPHGVLDMGGNVAEWTADWYAAPKSRAVRGGSWRALAWSARVSARASLTPETRDSSVGFRCVADAEPAAA